MLLLCHMKSQVSTSLFSCFCWFFLEFFSFLYFIYIYLTKKFRFAYVCMRLFLLLCDLLYIEYKF